MKSTRVFKPVPALGFGMHRAHSAALLVLYVFGLLIYALIMEKAMSYVAPKIFQIN